MVGCLLPVQNFFHLAPANQKVYYISFLLKVFFHIKFSIQQKIRSFVKALMKTINETSKNFIFSRLIQVTELYKIWDQRRDKYRELNNSTALTSVVDLDPDTDTVRSACKLRARRTEYKSVFFSYDINCWRKFGAYLA
jgi:hypothetical protein